MTSTTKLRTTEHDIIARAWGLLQQKQATIEQLKKADLPAGKGLAPERLQALSAAIEAEAAEEMLRGVLGRLPDAETVKDLAAAQGEAAKAERVAELRAEAVRAKTAIRRDKLLAEAEELEAASAAPVASPLQPQGLETDVSVEDFRAMLADPLSALDPRLGAFVALCHEQLKQGMLDAGIDHGEIEKWEAPTVGVGYRPGAGPKAAVFAVSVSTRDDGEGRMVHYGGVGEPLVSGHTTPTSSAADSWNQIVIIELDADGNRWTGLAEK